MREPGVRITSARTVGTFLAKGTCSETLFNVLNYAYGQPARHEECASQPLAGGIMQHGYQCGMLWGAALASGAQSHRLFGATPKAEARAVIASGHVVQAFRRLNRATDCNSFTGMDETSTPFQMTKTFLLKGQVIRCFHMAASYAPVALGEIDAALSGSADDMPPGPASCAAMLARRMGASEQHAVMAAGLAGGIGLS
ncbi:MAG: C-GCAxxG-C-C family (seleno)protein, partial [Myxococcota bacterium]